MESNLSQQLLAHHVAGTISTQGRLGWRPPPLPGKRCFHRRRTPTEVPGVVDTGALRSTSSVLICRPPLWPPPPDMAEAHQLSADHRQPEESHQHISTSKNTTPTFSHFTRRKRNCAGGWLCAADTPLAIVEGQCSAAAENPMKKAFSHGGSRVCLCLYSNYSAFTR